MKQCMNSMNATRGGAGRWTNWLLVCGIGWRHGDMEACNIRAQAEVVALRDLRDAAWREALSVCCRDAA